MGGSSSRSISNILNLYQENLDTDDFPYKDLLLDMKQQIDTNGTYKIYGVYAINQNTEITKNIMAEAETQFHLTYTTDTAQTNQMKDHFDSLSRLLQKIDTETSMKNMTKALKPSMDDNNKKAVEVLNNEGIDAAIKHMSTRPDGTIRSYAEMREMYG